MPQKTKVTAKSGRIFTT